MWWVSLRCRTSLPDGGISSNFPVKQYALEHNLPLLQPEKLKDEDFVEALRAWKADLQIVVAFRMLPEVVWNMPRLGTFNLHASCFRSIAAQPHQLGGD